MQRALKFCKWLALSLTVLLAFYWLSTTLATELLRHREKALSTLASIDAMKHWFFVLRLAIYLGCYTSCAWVMRKLKPEINASTIAQARKILIRFFIVYELFFGINIFSLFLR